MRLPRLLALATLCCYAAGGLIATRIHLETDHAPAEESGHEHDHEHEHDAATGGPSHDHPDVDHEQTGLRAFASGCTVVSESTASRITQLDSVEFIFVPPERIPHPMPLAEHLSPRAPPTV